MSEASARAGSSSASGSTAALDAAFRAERRALFLLCYRMTGSAADAEDLVQETFARALERPPARADLPWAPWLVRVAVNLARDHLRRRKRRAYVGPWLPSPIETDAFADLLPPPAATEPASTSGRYELLESVGFAFLLALEALTPSQRAVLLLCDVLEYSGRDAAEALGMSEPNVRQTLVRARRAMAAYDRRRCAPTQEQTLRTRDALGRFLAHLAQRDAAGIEALLAEDVVAWNDGGGEFAAARKPVRGRERVARFHVKISRGALPRLRLATLNGVPALVAEFEHAPPHLARRLAIVPELDAAGRLRAIYTVVATRKLAGLAPAA
ncbi:MAG TPA: sigma-70 family RNA polymerase sigma factor [Myxococcota bacterium]|jgi:RNA polymerase sigma-70 factor (ECF subfamily)|nr:sigma-70 family RNA polymerase sigma factor [Myxococcota bacterium]